MSKLNQAFQNGKVFMAFLTCGDPDLATTEKAIQAAVAGGAAPARRRNGWFQVYRRR